MQGFHLGDLIVLGEREYSSWRDIIYVVELAMFRSGAPPGAVLGQ
jgi:hypothetical protein